MLFEKNKGKIARIEVQKHFCETCSSIIRKQLQEIGDVKNIKLYPKDSLITFSFTNAYKLCTALNILSENGFYEKGERINEQRFQQICHC